MATRRKGLDVEFAEAYSDAWAPEFEREFMKTFNLSSLPGRDLDWRGSRWMTPADWTDHAIGIVPSYNEFDPKRVGAWLSTFSGIKVQPAREMSVALYIKGPRATLERMRDEAERAVVADEADVRRGELRLWWD